jgi:signal transduction histidine kinase
MTSLHERSLPAADPAARAASALCATGARRFPGAPGAPTLLIVDDRPDNLLAFEAILRRDDIQIVTANSGIDALEVLLRQEVALAMIDVQMPDMDGFTLAQLIRGVERTRYIPIIFVTAGSGDQSWVFKGYEAGAVDFLFKPIDEHILKSKLDVFVRLEKQRQQLLQAELIRETFMGVLGHDLRNPLHAISISAQTGLRRCRDRESREPFDLILSNSARMERMVEQLLGVTRIRLGGGVAISPLRSELRDIVTLVLDEWVENRSRFRLDAQGDTCGTWDADRLVQVVSNLVGNAVQHGAGGAAIDIRLDGTDGLCVAIEVHNAGPPIPQHVRANIFEPFRGTPNKGGLGLGLFISKQFVTAHGGSLDFVSDEHSGTTFRVTLPRHAMQNAAA